MAEVAAEGAEVGTLTVIAQVESFIVFGDGQLNFFADDTRDAGEGDAGLSIVGFDEAPTIGGIVHIDDVCMHREPGPSVGGCVIPSHFMRQIIPWFWWESQDQSCGHEGVARIPRGIEERRRLRDRDEVLGRSRWVLGRFGRHLQGILEVVRRWGE